MDDLRRLVALLEDEDPEIRRFALTSIETVEDGLVRPAEIAPDFAGPAQELVTASRALAASIEGGDRRG